VTKSPNIPLKNQSVSTNTSQPTSENPYLRESGTNSVKEVEEAEQF